MVSTSAKSEPQARGVPYRLQYAICPQGTRTDQLLRLEDQGRGGVGCVEVNLASGGPGTGRRI